MAKSDARQIPFFEDRELHTASGTTQLTGERARRGRTIGLPDYEVVALTLQGGGALGAYQAGIYQALHEVGIQPDWLAGISIGALNTAIIAGNAPEHRVARLVEFGEMICQQAYSLPLPPLSNKRFSIAPMACAKRSPPCKQ